MADESFFKSMEESQQQTNGSRMQPNGTMAGGYQQTNPPQQLGRTRGQAGIDRMPFFRGRGQDLDAGITPVQEANLYFRERSDKRAESERMLKLSLLEKKEEREYQKNLDAMNALEDFNGLDPKSPDYRKAKLGLMREHAMSLDHPAVKGFLSVADEEYDQWSTIQKDLADTRTKEEKEAAEKRATLMEKEATRAKVKQQADALGFKVKGFAADGSPEYGEPKPVEPVDPSAQYAEFNKLSGERLKAFTGSNDLSILGKPSTREGDDYVFKISNGLGKADDEYVNIPVAVVDSIKAERAEKFGLNNPVAPASPQQAPSGNQSGWKPASAMEGRVNQSGRVVIPEGGPVIPDTSTSVIESVTPTVQAAGPNGGMQKPVDVDELFIQGLRKLGASK